MMMFPLEYHTLEFGETFYCSEDSTAKHFAGLMDGDGWVTSRQGDLIGVVTERASHTLPKRAQGMVVFVWERLIDGLRIDPRKN